MIRKQYIDHLLKSTKATWVGNFRKELGKDGTWPDINYKDNKRSGWEPIQHVGRILEMAKVYRHPGQPLAGDKDLRKDILRALEHFVSKNYKCQNWWYNRIGVPSKMADALLLMGDDLPKNVAELAIKKVVSQAKIGMTGQNKVWLAEIVLVRSLFVKDEKTLKKARDVILSEVRVTTKEGIQPDWSFHQHGPQQQWGNYGGAFASSVMKWAKVLRGTTFGLSDEELSIMRSYVMEGTTWVVWKGRQDLSACGRQVYNDCQIKKGRWALSRVKDLITVDPKNKTAYEQRIADNKEDSVNTLVGNKHFWRSDIMVHRRPTWYASVKMSSKRVIGSETCNSENMLGRNLGNGALNVYLTGDETKNIQPVWDWHRIPGTTTDQSLKSLVPNGKVCRPPVSFVGGVSDGTTGIAVFDFKQDSLVAKKVWFFEEDRIVCLGAGITSDKGGQILTSVQQSLLNGPVVMEWGTASQGTHGIQPGSWVHHAGIGYHILADENPFLGIGAQTGNWRRLYTTRGDTKEFSLDVFNIWFDHGKTPKDLEYAYAIYPGVKASDMPSITKKHGIKLLSNTKAVQAITLKNGMLVRAAFYAAGELEYAKGKTIKTDTPCLVTVDFERKTIGVADPTQAKPNLTIIIDGNPISLDLAKGGSAGRSVGNDL